MSTDITNWLQVNIVNNPQFLQGLLALIIMILAFFLAFGKPTKKIPRRLGGMAVFVFGSFLFLYAYIAEFDRVLTVWATLILAAVAVFSFEESRRLREENRQREERERKERLLNEIIDWATDVLRCCHQFEIPITGSVNGELLLRRIEANRVTKLGEIACTSQYLMVVASKINTEVFDAIRSVVKNIGKTREVLMERVDIETKLDIGKVKQEEIDNIVAKYDEQLKKLELETEALIVVTTDTSNESI